jgi:ADP-ribose pyrophosphatase YjhB (NUDIX family)
MDLTWLRWARQLQALAQTGLAYGKDPYDIERYKSVRAIAHEIMASYSAVDHAHVRDLFTAERGYATPKVGVRGTVFHDDALLLVRERSDGLWTLPGGWADVNESPSEAVVREVYEESGYRTCAVKLLALYDRDRHGHPPYLYHVYNLFFLCELEEGRAMQVVSDPDGTVSIETDGAAFFREHEIPALSISRVTPTQITRLFEHRRHPEWPTDFD